MPAHGQTTGYVRVSSLDQNTARQLDGCQLDKVFIDKISGGNTARPQLDALRAYVREGDTVIVHSLDRLARNLDDLRKLVREFTSNGVRVQFVKEGLTFTGDDSPMANLLLSVMGAFAEFERALIRERQAEGIAQARARGVYQGRKPSLTQAQAADLVRRACQGESMAALAREFSIARQTAYSYLSASRRSDHPVGGSSSETSTRRPTESR